MSAPTSRREITRAIFQGGLMLAAGAAPAVAKAATVSKQQAFIEQIAFLHPNGRRVATKAITAGMKPEWLVMVMLQGFSDESDNHRPNLTFAPPGEAWRWFDPKGEVNRD